MRITRYINLASRHYAHRRFDFKVRVIVMTCNRLAKSLMNQRLVIQKNATRHWLSAKRLNQRSHRCSVECLVGDDNASHVSVFARQTNV